MPRFLHKNSAPTRIIEPAPMQQPREIPFWRKAAGWIAVSTSLLAGSCASNALPQLISPEQYQQLPSSMREGIRTWCRDYYYVENSDFCRLEELGRLASIPSTDPQTRETIFAIIQEALTRGSDLAYDGERTLTALSIIIVSTDDAETRRTATEMLVKVLDSDSQHMRFWAVWNLENLAERHPQLLYDEAVYKLLNYLADEVEHRDWPGRRSYTNIALFYAMDASRGQEFREHIIDIMGTALGDSSRGTSLRHDIVDAFGCLASGSQPANWMSCVNEDEIINGRTPEPWSVLRILRSLESASSTVSDEVLRRSVILTLHDLTCRDPEIIDRETLVDLLESQLFINSDIPAYQLPILFYENTVDRLSSLGKGQETPRALRERIIGIFETDIRSDPRPAIGLAYSLQNALFSIAIYSGTDSELRTKIVELFEDMLSDSGSNYDNYALGEYLTKIATNPATELQIRTRIIFGFFEDMLVGRIAHFPSSCLEDIFVNPLTEPHLRGSIIEAFENTINAGMVDSIQPHALELMATHEATEPEVRERIVELLKTATLNASGEWRWSYADHLSEIAYSSGTGPQLRRDIIRWLMENRSRIYPAE